MVIRPAQPLHEPAPPVRRIVPSTVALPLPLSRSEPDACALTFAPGIPTPRPALSEPTRRPFAATLPLPFTEST